MSLRRVVSAFGVRSARVAVASQSAMPGLATAMRTNVDRQRKSIDLAEFCPTFEELDPVDFELNGKTEWVGQKVFVGNLPANVGPIELKQFFRDIGDVRFIKIMGNGTSAIVEFTFPEDAALAITTLHDATLSGSALVIRPDKQDRILTKVPDMGLEDPRKGNHRQPSMRPKRLDLPPATPVEVVQKDNRVIAVGRSIVATPSDPAKTGLLTVQRLEKLFAPCGEIVEVFAATKRTFRVVFAEPSAAADALVRMSGHRLTEPDEEKVVLRLRVDLQDRDLREYIVDRRIQVREAFESPQLKQQRGVFVSGLSETATDEELLLAFRKVGLVSRVVLRARYGTATVLFTDSTDVGRAIEQMNGATIGGNTVVVEADRARHNEPNPEANKRFVTARIPSEVEGEAPTEVEVGCRIKINGVPTNLKSPVELAGKIRDLLSKAGVVTFCRVRPQGTAVLELSRPESAAIILEKFTRMTILGATLSMAPDTEDSTVQDKDSQDNYTPTTVKLDEDNSVSVGRALYIVNVAPEVTDDELRECVQKHGSVADIHRFERSAVVKYNHEQDAASAAVALHNAELKGNTLIVREDRRDPMVRRQQREVMKSLAQEEAYLEATLPSGEKTLVGRRVIMSGFVKEPDTPSLRRLVKSIGPVAELKYFKSSKSALVEYLCADHARRAIETLAGTVMDGGEIKLRPERDARVVAYLKGADGAGAVRDDSSSSSSSSSEDEKKASEAPTKEKVLKKTKSDAKASKKGAKAAVDTKDKKAAPKKQ